MGGGWCAPWAAGQPWLASDAREKRRTDERILGSGEFVERMIREAEETVRQEFSRGESGDAARRLVESACRKAGVSVKELRSGEPTGFPWKGSLRPGVRNRRKDRDASGGRGAGSRGLHIGRLQGTVTEEVHLVNNVPFGRPLRLPSAPG